MSKHTPAPWFVSDKFGSVGAIASKDGFIGFPCAVRDVDESRTPGESWLDMRKRTQPERLAIEREREANAHLIAAAP